ncbi:MAG: YfhL family 4Fe-4S dicluster ferredoxin [Burkholderiales bacterium]|nr:YfhL family 4Fe-4S dicluster ferredoxin [Burkholderiales bacterium]
MALKITDDCIACAACVEPCPNQAISEGPGIYVIDPERCRECVGDYDAPQCVPHCPVDAIIPDPERRETRGELLAKKERTADSAESGGN